MNLKTLSALWNTQKYENNIKYIKINLLYLLYLQINKSLLTETSFVIFQYFKYNYIIIQANE